MDRGVVRMVDQLILLRMIGPLHLKKGKNAAIGRVFLVRNPVQRGISTRCFASGAGWNAVARYLFCPH